MYVGGNYLRQNSRGNECSKSFSNFPCLIEMYFAIVRLPLKREVRRKQQPGTPAVGNGKNDAKATKRTRKNSKSGQGVDRVNKVLHNLASLLQTNTTLRC